MNHSIAFPWPCTREQATAIYRARMEAVHEEQRFVRDTYRTLLRRIQNYEDYQFLRSLILEGGEDV
jgi:hypothetical protein